VSGYVDLHDHSLFGVDDGAKTVEESVEMLRRLHAIGYRRVCLTPHIRVGYWENRRPDMMSRLETLRTAMDAAGLGGEDGVELRLGAEVHMDSGFLDLIDSGEVVPLGEGGYVLLELPNNAPPPQLEKLIFHTSLAGYSTVMAHPERYEPLMKDRKRLREIQARGTLLQISVTSLAGKFGWRCKRAAAKLINEGLCDYVATDVHSPDGVDKYVRPGIEKLHKMVGDTMADQLLRHVPQRVLGP
jgi:protein-tyrosine phosphatase